MRITAPHSKSLLALALTFIVACPADEEGGIDIDLDRAIRVNDASEEVLGEIVDEIDQGNLVDDQTRAAKIVSPEPGVAVPGGTPVTFSWSVGAKPVSPRHGTIDGSFVWMRLSGGGLGRDIDMVAVDETSWTPDATVWAEIAAATGPITITLTSANVVNGLIPDDGGPFRSLESVSTFSIAQ